MDYEKAIRELATENRNIAKLLEEKFPEVFKPRTVNLLEANGGETEFMGDILEKVGLRRRSISIAADAAHYVGAPMGCGFYFWDHCLNKPMIFDVPGGGWLITVEPKE